MKESQPPDMRSRAPQSAGKLLLNKNGSAEAASYGQLPRVAAPSVYFGPWAGLISCWPRPQQLLPVSAAGGGRRRCKKGAARPFQTPKGKSKWKNASRFAKRIFLTSPIYGFAEGVTFQQDFTFSKGVKSAAEQQIGGGSKCG